MKLDPSEKEAPVLAEASTRANYPQAESIASKPRKKKPDNKPVKEGLIPPTRENIRTALSWLSADINGDEWFKILCAVADGLGPDGRDLAEDWSRTAPDRYKAASFRDSWKSACKPGKTTIASLWKVALDAGWKPDSEAYQETEAERLAREQRQQKDRREAEQKAEREQKQAATKTANLWKAANDLRADHGYFHQKLPDIAPPPTLREIHLEQATKILDYPPKGKGGPLEGRLIVAPFKAGDKFTTVELIDEQGRKASLAGAGTKPRGCYWAAQPLPKDDGIGLVWIVAEGIATTLTGRAATEGNAVAVAAGSAANLSAVAKLMQERLPKGRGLILGDVGNGLKDAERAASETGAALAVPSFTPEQVRAHQGKHGKAPTDFNDLAALAGLDEVRRQLHQAMDGPTSSHAKQEAAGGVTILDEPLSSVFPNQSDTGRRMGTIPNLRHLFQGYGITISYDELLKKQTIRFNSNADHGHWDLRDNAGIANIRSIMALNRVAVSALELLPALFSENAKNPILEFIESVPWDGADRIKALADTLTVAEQDLVFRDEALLTWLVQCVAAADGAQRTPNPKAIPKYELAFILQGGQGVKKTSWFKRLLPKPLSAYIIDGAHLDPADKETVRTCISAWICELGELDSTFRRADISRLKAFLSKQTDTLRLPYDRAESQFRRRTSFCGSVNPEQFLNDSTGARRFLPLQVLACDSLHEIDMQQLWAQVWRLYLDGRQWWATPELEAMLAERHERHAETIPIDELIAETFDLAQKEKTFGHRHYTATRILMECGIKEPKTHQASAVNACLKRLGFRQLQNEGLRGYWLLKRAHRA